MKRTITLNLSNMFSLHYFGSLKFIEHKTGKMYLYYSKKHLIRFVEGSYDYKNVQDLKRH